MKNVLNLMIILLILAISIYSETIRLQEITNPEFDIHIHGDRLYIPEASNTYIYNMKNFSMTGMFGKKGEGPGEFRGEVYINYQKERLLVESAGKISYFSLDGEFFEEKIFPQKTFVKRISPVGERYAGYGGTKVENGINYIVLSFYNEKMEKKSDFTRTKSNFQKDGTIKFMSGTFNFKVYKERIYVQYLGDEMMLGVFDQAGQFLFKIGDPDFKNRNVSGKDKKEAMDYFRKFMPNLYTRRQRIRFSDKWGGVGTFFFDESEDSLYIITYVKDITGKYLFYKYTTDGKFINKFYMDVGYRDIWAPYPLDIENGKLYQLVENDDDEDWDLVITDINKKN